MSRVLLPWRPSKTDPRPLLLPCPDLRYGAITCSPGTSLSSDPARRQAVVGGFDFDATVQMHHALACCPRSDGRVSRQFSADARTGTEGQEACRFAAAAQRHHEQSGASIFSALGVAGLRAPAVIDLGLFSRRGEDHPVRWLSLVPAGSHTETSKPARTHGTHAARSSSSPRIGTSLPPSHLLCGNLRGPGEISRHLLPRRQLDFWVGRQDEAKTIRPTA